MDIKEKLMELIDMGSGCPDGKDPFGDYCESCRYKESTMCHLESLADYLIDNGVTVTDGKDTDVPAGWIPVTERLPEHFGVFIVAIREPYKERVGKDCADFDPFAKTWLPSMCWDKGYAVTHWMPLPEPPKGE